jgi:hypothetical protein
MKIEGPGSESESGSISQRHGSAETGSTPKCHGSATLVHSLKSVFVGTKVAFLYLINLVERSCRRLMNEAVERVICTVCCPSLQCSRCAEIILSIYRHVPVSFDLKFLLKL